MDATAEQLGATVRVRVIAGAIPPKNYTGAILHRDELPEAGTYFDQNRCVLALLDGWTETQLRNPQCRFIVFRNIPDSVGEVRGSTYSGRLFQYDPKTGIAAITYPQGFSADTDIGFRFDRARTNDARVTALKTFASAAPAVVASDTGPSSGNGPRRSPAQSRVLTPLEIKQGNFTLTNGDTGSLAFWGDDSDQRGDLSPILVRKPMQLSGFLRVINGNTASLVRADTVKVTIDQRGVKPVSVGFDGNQGNRGRASLVINVSSTGPEMPKNVVLLKVPIKSGDHVDLAGFNEPYRAIQDKAPQGLSRHRDNDLQFYTALDSPTTEGEEMAYMLQLGWGVLPGETKPSIYSAPFIVRFTRKGGGIVPATEGIENLNQPKPRSTDKALSSQTFDLPASVEPVMNFWRVES